MSERVCGECVACCTVLAVPALGKAEGVTCEHCTTGCVIYKNRPASCANYACAWLRGWLDKNDRPDKCGVIVNLGNGKEVYRMTGRELYVVQPTRIGCEALPAMNRILYELTARDYVVVRLGNKRTLFGPKDRYIDDVAKMLNNLTKKELANDYES